MEAGAPRDYPPPPMPRQPGRGQTITALVLAVVSVVILPIVLGPAAVAFGVAGQRKGDPLGRWGVVAGVVGTITGLALAAAVRAGS